MLWPQCKRYRVVDSNDPHELTLQVTDDDVEDQVKDTHYGRIDLANSNLPDVFAIIESDNAFFFLSTYRGTTLQDLITYNPGVLSSNLKKSFVVYQILRALASLHDRGVLHGRYVYLGYRGIRLNVINALK